MTQAIPRDRIALRATMLHCDTTESDLDALIDAVRPVGLALGSA